MTRYKKGCKFCDLIKKQSKEILFENGHIVVLFGRPHHKGHVLVMTRSHEEDLMALKEKTLDSFFNDTVRICKALGKAIKPDRFNLEYLDNWDPHVHWNIYPRFKNDPDFGQPPKIPKKGEKFEPRDLTYKELKIFLKEIDKIEKKL